MQQQKLELGFVFLLIFLVSCTQKSGTEIIYKNQYCDVNKTIPKVELCDYNNYVCTAFCDNINFTIKTTLDGYLPCAYPTMTTAGEINCKIFCPEARFVGYNC